MRELYLYLIEFSLALAFVLFVPFRNVFSLFHTYIISSQDRQRVYMVLEYADGGDALKHIQSTGAISEDRARLWTSQIASAVRYMHDLDVAHRDLKLENLLIDSSHNIKICDFGFVREATPGDLSQTYCGSKSYAAPEILQARILL